MVEYRKLGAMNIDELYVVFGRRKPRLRASDFMAGNKDQLEELRRMGIQIVTMKDGRVQLLHTAAEVRPWLFDL